MKQSNRLKMREKPRVDLPDVKCRFLQLAPQEMRIVPAEEGSTAFALKVMPLSGLVSIHIVNNG